MRLYKSPDLSFKAPSLLPGLGFRVFEFWVQGGGWTNTCICRFSPHEVCLSAGVGVETQCSAAAQRPRKNCVANPLRCQHGSGAASAVSMEAEMAEPERESTMESRSWIDATFTYIKPLT